MRCQPKVTSPASLQVCQSPHSLRWHLFHSASIGNTLNLLWIHALFIHTTALLFMNALCKVTPFLFYSALLYWSVSFSLYFCA